MQCSGLFQDVMGTLLTIAGSKRHCPAKQFNKCIEFNFNALYKNLLLN